MEKLLEDLREELYEHLMPFWHKLIDRDHGGFYGEVSYDLIVEKTSDKGGIATARLLWSYARLYRHKQDSALLPYMHDLYRFLVDKMRDEAHGGIYWKVDFKGEPSDKRKHIYAQGFAVYALAEYHRVTGDVDSLELAVGLFELIEKVGYDQVHQGYLEEFTEDWQLKNNEMLSENGVEAYFTMNTYLHLLEAYTNLYRVWKSETLRTALIGLLDTFKNRFYDRDKGILLVFLDASWESLIDMNSYGHDIEATWLIQEAMDVLEIADADISEMIRTLGENVRKRGVLEDGSLINERVKGITDTTRVWWVQAEAMVGFLNLYQQTGDATYLTTVEGLWRYIKDHLVDKRQGGEWYWSIEPDGLPTQRSVAGLWKTPYHNLRSCVEVIERLTSLGVGK